MPGAEAFDPEPLRRHAAHVARRHRALPALRMREGKISRLVRWSTLGWRRREPLLLRLEENRQVLEVIGDLLGRGPSGAIEPSAAEHWLAENQPLVRETIRGARRGLSAAQCKVLPRLSGGDNRGLPRAYDLVLELAYQVDGRIGLESLRHFVAAYQEDSRLTLAELWAIPTMLQLALVEHLCRAALSLAWRYLADGNDALEQPPNLDAADPLALLTSVRNGIGSLRAMARIDWKEFVEEQSEVERILRGDPLGAYARMDFASRDEYRRQVERMARASGRCEEEAAAQAVELARETLMPAEVSPGEPTSMALAKRRHVGYYLVGKGRATLEARLDCRPGIVERLLRLAARRTLAAYLGAIGLVWALSLQGILKMALPLGLEALSPWVAAALAFLVAGASLQFAVAMVNWASAMAVPPRRMLRMDFRDGIPAEYATIVAVPTMLTHERTIRSLAEHLELRYLANRDEHLRYVLLTDFPDADYQSLPSDRRLVDLACSEIRRLNERYAPAGRTLFYLLHRPRRWNAREGVWMGHERKRGKLAALNGLLRSGSAAEFSVTVGDLESLASVRLVITLDSDTQLPPDTARQLVACMAHPLNRPEIDPLSRVVVDGYGIMQPRLGTPIPDARRSLFGRLSAPDAGIDPYSRQASDLYHDLFAQGSFIGKGIYDVEAFETCLAGRFPDNRVLSHDLIEGCFARSGLVNDVELFEGFPSRFLADMSRRHRWIRGDWQIAAWLSRRMTLAHGRGGNPLSALSRWKIFDNLRRSLTPAMVLAFLLAGWLLAPEMAALWTLLALGIEFGPTLLCSLPGLVRKSAEKPWGFHLKERLGRLGGSLARDGIGWCVLPFTVHCHLDAVVRTLYRLHVSRRRLLEWTTASEAEARSGRDCRDHYELLWACPVVALGTGAALGVMAPGALAWAGPALASWLAGPALAWWISRPLRRRAPRLSGRQTAGLRRWARQTWHYFETFASQEDHALPPDHAREQESPHGTWVVVPRTSPTNIGMGLLADLAAMDLGYLDMTRLMIRTARVTDSLRRMERHRGHFYNWYDTRTLEPIGSRYVSTVDSGNLWGSLATMETGLEELRRRPLAPPRLWDGLLDTLEVLASLHRAEPFFPAEAFETGLASLQAACQQAPCGGARAVLRHLEEVSRAAARFRAELIAPSPAAGGWLDALVRQCEAAGDELARLAFWAHADYWPGHLPVHDPWGTLPKVPWEGLRAIRLRIERLDADCTLGHLPEAADQVIGLVDDLLREPTSHGDWAVWHGKLASVFERLRAAARQSAEEARRLLAQASELADACRELAAMDFSFLWQRSCKLLAIGFDVAGGRRDESAYDLLASEARLTSFLAVSTGQLPVEHWYALGRSITLAGDEPTLLSWSGSMFEYLMPMLWMPSYPTSILERSCRAAVAWQIEHARRFGVPWGISESCCHVVEPSLSYRYRAFGVPGLGLDRGLGEHLVIAPYASALAAMLAPCNACDNLEELERLGCLSPYGFFDALDYTPGRALPDGRPTPCRAVMAHHSGMALVAMAGVLTGRQMERRLFAHPSLRAHSLLLQECLSPAACPVNPELLDTGQPVWELRTAPR